MITQELLKKILHYNHETGIFTWIVKKAMNINVFDVAGFLDKSNGYYSIGINGYKYKAHRLAWLYFYGDCQMLQIDHINGNRADNRIKNLRLATNSENQQNRKISKNNTTGFIGVTKLKITNKYIAKIRVNKKQIHIGTFDTAESAFEAYIKHKQIYHTFNPNLQPPRVLRREN